MLVSLVIYFSAAYDQMIAAQAKKRMVKPYSRNHQDPPNILSQTGPLLTSALCEIELQARSVTLICSCLSALVHD